MDRAPSQPGFPVVLVIDDDMVSREVTAALLTMDGCTVHAVDSGEAALRLIAEKRCCPGVVIADAQMLGLSGVELIQALRDVCGQAAIYVISGSQPVPGLIAAADGFLLKPFTMEALKALVSGLETSPPASLLRIDEPVVSAEILSQLRGLMSEKAVREIFAAAVTDLDMRLDGLETAIARNDREAMWRIGHAIKGGCGMAGAAQAARLGALLEAETAGKDNHLDNKLTLLSDLRKAAVALHRILEAEFTA
jgi:CheY-like chemotaxis protein